MTWGWGALALLVAVVGFVAAFVAYLHSFVRDLIDEVPRVAPGGAPVSGQLRRGVPALHPAVGFGR